MIQRIQSLFLLVVFILIGCMFLTPLATIGEIVLNLNGITADETAELVPILSSPIPFSALALGIMLLTVFTIFSFKNRKRQLFLGRVNYVLILGFVVWIFVSISNILEQLELQISNPYGIGTYLPLIALGAQLLANRAIKRDEELVKSLDRLR